MSCSHAETLQYSGLSSFSEARWWAVGAAKLEGEDLNYFGIEGLRIAGGQGIIIIAVCQARDKTYRYRVTSHSLAALLCDIACVASAWWHRTHGLAGVQVLLMFGPEYARACGIEALEPLGLYLPGDKNYPGKH